VWRKEEEEEGKGGFIYALDGAREPGMKLIESEKAKVVREDIRKIA
jgi:hypothetical protein